MKKRLKALEAKSTQDGLALSESQLAASEKATADKESPLFSSPSRAAGSPYYPQPGRQLENVRDCLKWICRGSCHAQRTRAAEMLRPRFFRLVGGSHLIPRRLLDRQLDHRAKGRLSGVYVETESRVQNGNPG
jgi:hypothetical protein